MKIKQFENFKLYVRENDWGFWQNDVYEPEETKLIKKLVKKDMMCLDIGANIGYYSVLMGKRTHYRVIAFEPEPSNYEILQRNIMENELFNVMPIKSAVGTTNGIQELYLCDTNNGMNRMFKSKFCDKSKTVNVVGIDEFFGVGKIDFIKIDTEGAELDVINGMYQTLSKHHPTIVMEFHPPTLEEKGDNPEKLYYRLKNLGYDIRLVPNIDQTISYEDLYKETMKEPSGRNILCLKR